MWWQQVTRKFDGDDGADDTFLVPDDGVITEAEAVAAARAAILSAKELAPDALDAAQPVADLYVTQQQPDRPRWNVQFKLFREGSDSYVERVYSAVVDARSGEVLSDPDTGVPHPDEAAAQQSAARPDTPLFQAIDAMAESVQRDIASFGAWPLSLKAEYARDIAPRVRAIVDSGDLTPLDNGAGPNLYVIAAAAYDYGLPGEGDLAQEDALERAREAARSASGSRRRRFRAIPTCWSTSTRPTRTRPCGASSFSLRWTRGTPWARRSTICATGWRSPPQRAT